MPTKYVEVKGYATYYYYVGETTLPEVTPDFSRGRKIILVHGAGSNAHSPIALDLPGHGRSAGVEGLATTRDYADFVGEFMTALKIESAVIGGHSLGGAIAMDFAIRWPQRTQALILIATAAKVNIPDERVAALRAVARGRAPQAFTTDSYSPKTVQTNFDLVREGWMEQIKTDPRVRYTDCLAVADLRDQVAKIRTPTLVMAGADDQITTPADAEFIARQIPGARLQVIADAAHAVRAEKPAEVHAAIDSFLGELK
jgi:pimeloyl-ACP methyl ester carboxylesterase